jgi:hypothetical protein
VISWFSGKIVHNKVFNPNRHGDYRLLNQSPKKILLRGSRLRTKQSATSSSHPVPAHVVASRAGLTRELDALHLGFLDLGPGHGDREHLPVSTPFSSPASTCSVLAFSGSRKRLANRPLPRSTRCHLSSLIVLLLHVALLADDQHVAVLHLVLDLLLLHAEEVGLEHVRLGRLLSVDARAGEGGGVTVARRRDEGAEDGVVE